MQSLIIGIMPDLVLLNSNIETRNKLLTCLNSSLYIVQEIYLQ